MHKTTHSLSAISQNLYHVDMAEDTQKQAEDRKNAKPDAAAALAAFAMADPSTARLYANGFTLGLTNADAYIILQQFGRPIAVVNMSYTLTKTLSEKLQKMVADWEAKTGETLQTTDSIEHAYETKKATI